MAALFQCFRKQRNRQNFDLNDGNSKTRQSVVCKCDKADKVIQCPHCKSTLIGYWEHKEGKIDGGGAGVSSTENHSLPKVEGSRSRYCPCGGCHEPSEGSSSPSAGNSPTSIVPPRMCGTNNEGFYINDYTPSANGSVPGMSYQFVAKNNPNYNMNHPRRGKAIIFNFNNFDDNANTQLRSLDLLPRHGSDKDKTDLEQCLRKLSFDVVSFDNLRRQRFDQQIDRIRREDHTDADCLVLAIMTHGEKNAIYTSDGSLIPVNSVWEEFASNKCPTLAGKPKIFIIQACRGDRYDHGTVIRSSGSNDSARIHNDVIDSGSFSYVIPNAADIFVAFSCPLGHYSWRHPEKGSWFIQSICKIFDEHAYKDLELQALFTMVAREVALNYESNTNHIDSDKKKQVPSTSSTLIRNVIFKPKGNITSTSQNATTVINKTSTLLQESNIDNNVPNGQQTISLQQVQMAVAGAQVSTSTSAVIADLAVPNISIPETPVVSVMDNAVVQSENEPEIIQRNEESNGDLESDEDPTIADAQNKPILPPN